MSLATPSSSDVGLRLALHTAAADTSDLEDDISLSNNDRDHAVYAEDPLGQNDTEPYVKMTVVKMFCLSGICDSMNQTC